MLPDAHITDQSDLSYVYIIDQSDLGYVYISDQSYHLSLYSRK